MTNEHEGKGGLFFSLRVERPLVIETPSGSVEIYAAKINGKRGNHRTVRIMVPDGCVAHMGEREVQA